MELCIAIGIGLWFVVSGAIAYFHFAKSFENKDKEEKN